MERREGPDGETLFVDTGDGERGADGPFYVAYLDSDGTRRWGYVCGNCDSARTAMDSMARSWSIDRVGDTAGRRKAAVSGSVQSYGCREPVHIDRGTTYGRPGRQSRQSVCGDSRVR